MLKSRFWGYHIKSLFAMLVSLMIGSAFSVGCATTKETAAKPRFDTHRNEYTDPTSHADSRADSDVSFSDGRLESYIAYALKNSPALEALFERWQAGINRIAGARRLPDPVISYAYYIRNVETKVGPQRHRLSLKQTFPWPTKFSAGADAVAAKAEALERRFVGQ